MLSRFLGIRKEEPAVPKIEDVQESLTLKVNKITAQIESIDEKLKSLVGAIKASRNPTDLKRQACSLMSQKRSLEKYLLNINNQLSSIVSVQSTFSEMETNMMVAKSIKSEYSIAKASMKQLSAAQKEFHKTLPEVRALQQRNESFQQMLNTSLCESIDDTDVEAEWEELLQSVEDKPTGKLEDPDDIEQYLSKLPPVPKNVMENDFNL